MPLAKRLGVVDPLPGDVLAFTATVIRCRKGAEMRLAAGRLMPPAGE